MGSALGADLSDSIDFSSFPFPIFTTYYVACFLWPEKPISGKSPRVSVQVDEEYSKLIQKINMHYP